MFKKISQKILASPFLIVLAIGLAIIADIMDLIEKIYDYPVITILVIITIIIIIAIILLKEKLQLVSVKSPNRIAIMTVLAMTLIAVVVSSYIWLFCCPSICTLEGYIKMAPVPQDIYYLDKYPNVRPYIKGIGKNKVIIEKSFMIQTGEVTVGEFRRFVESSWLNKEHLETLGTDWEKSKDEYEKLYQDNSPISNLSWAIAEQYAQWMSQQTACQLRLPTKEQWAAAAMAYADEQTKQKRRLQRIDIQKQKPDHLLFNREEWSRSPCGEGNVFILGYDYYPFYNVYDLRRLRCTSKKASRKSIGFRLVKE